jgi:hypothetical protein
MTHKYDIAVLLATRGRTTSLFNSIKTLFEKAHYPSRIQLMLAFDRDDSVGPDFFCQQVQPWLDLNKFAYTAMRFEPMGYVRLNVYNNQMAAKTDSDWFVIWNDDAVMQTMGWDLEITSRTGQFKLLAFHTHHDHPYSIFPIVPRQWYDLLGYISPHQAQDAWLSQQAYMLDVWERIEVDVLHDRFDLTGNNNDETYRKRSVLEGRPEDPNDFHSVQQIELRHKDCAKLAGYIKHALGGDVSFFENVFKGLQDPWEKLAKNDINKQMVQFANPHTHFKEQIKESLEIQPAKEAVS